VLLALINALDERVYGLWLIALWLKIRTKRKLHR
jgi:hypothetical protein